MGRSQRRSRISRPCQCKCKLKKKAWSHSWMTKELTLRAKKYLFRTAALRRRNRIFCALYICQMSRLDRSRRTMINLTARSRKKEWNMREFWCSCATKKGSSRRISVCSTLSRSSEWSNCCSRFTKPKFSTNRSLRIMLIRWLFTSLKKGPSRRS